MAADTRDFSRLLDEFKRGDVQASSKLIALVYADLHRLARAQMGPGPRNRGGRDGLPPPARRRAGLGRAAVPAAASG
jgi:hypothetical protein